MGLRIRGLASGSPLFPTSHHLLGILGRANHPSTPNLQSAPGGTAAAHAGLRPSRRYRAARVHAPRQARISSSSEPQPVRNRRQDDAVACGASNVARPGVAASLDVDRRRNPHLLRHRRQRPSRPCRIPCGLDPKRWGPDIIRSPRSDRRRIRYGSSTKNAGCSGESASVVGRIPHAVRHRRWGTNDAGPARATSNAALAAAARLRHPETSADQPGFTSLGSLITWPASSGRGMPGLAARMASRVRR